MVVFPGTDVIEDTGMPSPLKLVAIYAPPGPEAILREMPGCTVVPPGQVPRRD